MDTPVALFLFRRPEQTARVFAAIRASRPKVLFLVADGARDTIVDEELLVKETRQVVEIIDWPCEVHRLYSDVNLGLRQRILSGLDSIFSKVDRAIILEDDCLPAVSFFEFCDELLRKYANRPEISLVSGFNFAPITNAKIDYFFSKSTYIWGWATWARAWREFRSSPQIESWSEQELEQIRPTFASRIQEREFLGMARMGKDLNTWDISLAVWVRQSGSLTIIPNRNLITNIGFGEEATHTKFEAFDVQVPVSDFIDKLRHPASIFLDPRIEKNAWRKKSLRWFTFPILHPVDFVSRLLAFLKTQKSN